MVKNKKNVLSAILRRVADILDEVPANEALVRILAALDNVPIDQPRAPGSGRREEEEREDLGAAKATVTPQETALQRERVIAHFGSDILSDDEFPTRDSLVQLARRVGVSVGARESKSSVRQKLLASSELSNLDSILRSSESTSDTGELQRRPGRR